MRKFVLILLLFTASICVFAGCSSEPDVPQKTEEPIITVEPTSTINEKPEDGNSSKQENNKPEEPTKSAVATPAPSEQITEATVYVHYLYNRSFDKDGNYLTDGHIFYSICGICGEMGSWFDEECPHCGAKYAERIVTEEYETYVRDANDWSIIYSTSYEPFDVK